MEFWQKSTFLAFFNFWFKIEQEKNSLSNYFLQNCCDFTIFFNQISEDLLHISNYISVSGNWMQRYLLKICQTVAGIIYDPSIWRIFWSNFWLFFCHSDLLCNAVVSCSSSPLASNEKKKALDSDFLLQQWKHQPFGLLYFSFIDREVSVRPTLTLWAKKAKNVQNKRPTII